MKQVALRCIAIIVVLTACGKLTNTSKDAPANAVAVPVSAAASCMAGNTSPSGTIYYVSNSGSDTNAGTKDAPWATLQYAANQALAGDTVLVKDGTYAGFFSVNGGTEKNPITFKADGSNVIINTSNAHTKLDNVNIENTDDVVVDGFIVKDAQRAGIRVAESTCVVIRNNRVGPSGMWGIFTGFAPEVNILNNKTFDSQGQHGIYVSNSRVSNDNPVIRGNETYGNHYTGIQVNGDCESGGDGIISGAVIEGNIIHDNASKGTSIVSMQDSVIQNNLIYNNGVGGRGAGGIHLTDQGGCGQPSSRNKIINNTIIEPHIAGIRITDGATENQIVNNIVFTSASLQQPIEDEVGGSFVDKDFNLMLTSISQGLFVNPAKNDYHLMRKSPAIDAGKTTGAPNTDMEGIKRPQGSGIDLGPFEFMP